MKISFPILLVMAFIALCQETGKLLNKFGNAVSKLVSKK